MAPVSCALRLLPPPPPVPSVACSVRLLRPPPPSPLSSVASVLRLPRLRLLRPLSPALVAAPPLPAPSSSCAVRFLQRPPQAADSAGTPGGGGADEGLEGDAGKSRAETEELTSEFMRYVAMASHDWPAPDPSPTALMPPTTVVKMQMDALMRNDWPEVESGVRAAFRFALPEGANDMRIGDVVAKAVRSWEASESFLTLEQFSTMLQKPEYCPIVNCDSWEFCSPLKFHRPGDGSALQAVRVRYTTPSSTSQQERVYTFILQKVLQGPYKGCFLVTGVRLGDYANV